MMIIRIIVTLFCLSINISLSITQQLSPIPNSTLPNQQKNKIVQAVHDEDNKKLYILAINPKKQIPLLQPALLIVRVGSFNKTCHFLSYYDICVIQSKDKQNAILEITCGNTLCDFTWKMHKIAARYLANTDKIQPLYQLPKNSSRLLVSIFCRNAVNQQMKIDKMVIAFSNVPFKRIQVTGFVQHVVFQEIKEGYLFFILNPKLKNCMSMKVINSEKAISKQLVEDFIREGKKISYELVDIPNKQNFYFNISVNHPSDMNLYGDVNISITGENGNNKERQTLRSNKISFFPSYKALNLKYVIPKFDASLWKNIRLQLQTTAKLLLLSIQQHHSNRIQIQPTQFAYFDLQQDQQLSYQSIPESQTQRQQVLHIIPSDPSMIKVSNQTKCQVGKVCQFLIEALSSVKGYIYFGLGYGKIRQILIYNFNNSHTFTHKIKKFQNIYLTKKFEKNKIIQVSINSSDVIVYFANKQLCQLTSSICYERIGTMDKPFIYYPSHNQNGQGMFLVKALASCQFSIQLIALGNEYLELKNSQPFAYTMGEYENQLKLKYSSNKPLQININIFDSSDSLQLILVNNSEQYKIDKKILQNKGIALQKNNNEDIYNIKMIIRKINLFDKKLVHFIVIASGIQQIAKLDTRVPCNQILSGNKTKNKKYVFQLNQFQKSLYFSIHNKNKQQVSNIRARLSNLWQKYDQKYVNLVINHSQYYFIVNQLSRELCFHNNQYQYDKCLILIQLSPEIKAQLNITLTLINKYNYIQLHDGMVYNNTLNIQGEIKYFYYYPRNNGVNVFFNSSFAKLKFKYLVFSAFNNFRNQVKPDQWATAFPELNHQLNNVTNQIQVLKHTIINKKQFQQCQPYCVVLISILKLQKASQISNFNIIINSIRQLYWNERVQTVIKNDGYKQYIIDIGIAIENQKNILLYIDQNTGFIEIVICVYSDEQKRIPDEKQFDFRYNSSEFIEIPIKGIKEIITREHMEENKNISLYIKLQAKQDSHIIFSFHDQKIERNKKMIRIDNYQHIILEIKQQKLFYTPITTAFKFLIKRQNGCPFLMTSICKKNIDVCINQIVKQKNPNTTKIDKEIIYSVEYCNDCFFIFKISSGESKSQVFFSLESSNEEILLYENGGRNTFSTRNQIKKFVIYTARNKNIDINVNVLEGEAHVQVNTQNKIREQKNGSKIINFRISAQQTQLNKSQNNATQFEDIAKLQKKLKMVEYINNISKKHPQLISNLFNIFGFNKWFIKIYVLVKSQNYNKNTNFTVIYSVGNAALSLQDGLIYNYMLQPNKQTIVYYSSLNPVNYFLTILMKQHQYLQNLKVTLKSCESANSLISSTCWLIQNITKPQINRSGPYPSLTYSQLNKQHLSASISSNESKQIIVAIFQEQVIILPFDREFSFVLGNYGSIVFGTQVVNSGYIQVIVRNCHNGNPTFLYTFSYEDLKQGKYIFESELGEYHKNSYKISMRPGYLYMKIKNGRIDKSMMSINVHFSENKIANTQQFIPGNNGNIQYSITNSVKGQLTITPPTGANKHALKYYLIITQKYTEIYPQLICPISYFIQNSVFNLGRIQLQEISPLGQLNGLLAIPFNFSEDVVYVGVKIVDGEGKEVYYKPIQVSTLYAHFSRAHYSYKLELGFIVTMMVLSFVVCMKKTMKRGYKPVLNQF